MRRASRSFTGMSCTMSRYSIADARMDNPHRTARELPAIVNEANTGKVRRPYRPLRSMLSR